MEPNPYCSNRSPDGDACGACVGCVAEVAAMRLIVRGVPATVEDTGGGVTLAIARHPSAARWVGISPTDCDCHLETGDAPSGGYLVVGYLDDADAGEVLDDHVSADELPAYVSLWLAR